MTEPNNQDPKNTDWLWQLKRKDSQEFVIKPVSKNASPLDVPGIDLGLKRAEIIQFIREGRRYSQ